MHLPKHLHVWPVKFFFAFLLDGVNICSNVVLPFVFGLPNLYCYANVSSISSGHNSFMFYLKQN